MRSWNRDGDARYEPQGMEQRLASTELSGLIRNLQLTVAYCSLKYKYSQTSLGA